MVCFVGCIQKDEEYDVAVRVLGTGSVVVGRLVKCAATTGFGMVVGYCSVKKNLCG